MIKRATQVSVPAMALALALFIVFRSQILSLLGSELGFDTNRDQVAA